MKTDNALSPIQEFPDYFASEEGEVYSMKPITRNAKPPTEPRLLKKYLVSKKGTQYFGVHLCRNGKVFNKRISVLMLETFISPRPRGMYACHGIKGSLVDTLDNLRWQTPKQNTADTYRDGTICRGERNGMTKLTKLKVLKIKERLAKKELQCLIAKTYNISPSTISDIYRKKSWGWL